MTQAPDGSVGRSTLSALFEFNRQRRPLRSVPLASGGAHRLLADSLGTLWVGTPDGLQMLKPGAAALRSVTLTDGRLTGGRCAAASSQSWRRHTAVSGLAARKDCSASPPANAWRVR